MNKILGILLCALIAGIATILSQLKIGSFSLEIIGAPVFSILLGCHYSGVYWGAASDGDVLYGVADVNCRDLSMCSS